MKKILLVGVFTAAVIIAQPPQKKTDQSAQTQKAAKEETTPQKDLVCGMTVDPKTAGAKYAYKGKMYYFCSKEDQQEFAKSPDKFVKK